ncbi:MAG: efflux RND transporter periplasmic adaptor subunit [Pseudomonadota bacterium]
MRAIILSLSILIGLTLRTEAEDVLIFEGRIEAVERAQIYSRAEGRVSEVLATAGMRVEAGAVLARLEADLATLEVEAAQAELDRQDALLQRAQDRLDRAERLSQSGSSSAVALIDAKTDLDLAEAEHRMAVVALDRARIALSDTDIRATQSGIVERVQVGVGALLEFDAGLPPLFEIIDLDPVRVVYDVPYQDRLEQMARLGVTHSDDLLRRVRLELRLEDGTVLAQGVTPEATSVRVEEDSASLKVWANVPNPDALLRPGMRVIVQSTITSEGEDGLNQ